MLLLDLRKAHGPLYRRVYHALKSTIRDGRLLPGARLPSTRELASDLRVSRNTVMLAYEQLLAEGYVVSRNRATTSVASALPTSTMPASSRAMHGDPPAISAYARRLTRLLGTPPARSTGLQYDFRYGEPPVDEFPREIWRRLLAARARRSARDAFGYADPAGYAPLRAALAEYLKRARGVVAEPDQIVITSGSQQGFDLAARVLLDPGDVVVVEEPHYPGVTIPFEAAGARLAYTPVDGGGLQTHRLPPRARLAYVTPCHQFPSGVIMPLERRLALLAWAARTNSWVIEDDYVSEFRYEGARQGPCRHARLLRQERELPELRARRGMVRGDRMAGAGHGSGGGGAGQQRADRRAGQGYRRQVVGRPGDRLGRQEDQGDLRHAGGVVSPTRGARSRLPAVTRSDATPALRSSCCCRSSSSSSA